MYTAASVPVEATSWMYGRGETVRSAVHERGNMKVKIKNMDALIRKKLGET